MNNVEKVETKNEALDAKWHKQFMQNALLAKARKRRLQGGVEKKEHRNEHGVMPEQRAPKHYPPQIKANSSTSSSFIYTDKISKQKGPNAEQEEEDDDISIIELRSSRKKEGEEEDEILFVEERNKKVDGRKKKKSDGGRIGEEADEERMRSELLRRMATQALVRDAKRSAQRAEMFGPQGWLKPRSLSTNKVFLARTLQSVELDRREREEKMRMRRDEREEERRMRNGREEERRRDRSEGRMSK